MIRERKNRDELCIYREICRERIQKNYSDLENDRKLRYCPISFSAKQDNGLIRDNILCTVPRKTLSLGYLAGGANRFLAASPTAGGRLDGGWMACGGCGGWPAKRGSFCRRQIWRGPPLPPTPRPPSTAAHPVTWGRGGGDGEEGGIDG